MSAIWGAVSTDGRSLPAGIAQKMKRSFEKCIIDAFSEYEDEFAVFGCGLQYITKEARHEKLPTVAEDGQIIFTADIMIDNREELLEKLGKSGVNEIIPDGELAFEMFRRFGEDCLNDLLGSYTFAYYDKKNKKLSLVMDAMGNRFLYYRLKDGVIYFSTLAEPILNAAGNDGVNGRWITEFLALDNMAISLGTEESPYAGMLQILPAHIITVDGGQLRKRRYWMPDYTELKLKSDDEYKKLLKDTLKTAVNCVLRDDRVASQLSGGLDSTSVVCYAARELKKQGKTIHTYTSVPEDSYVSNSPAYYVTNEKPAVLKTKEYLENVGCKVECKFLDLPGVNGWDGRTEQMKALEFPYKSTQNLLWITETMRSAYNDGSRILLSAGFGNVSISYSSIETYLNDLLRRKRFIEFFRQHRLFSRAYGFGRKQGLKNILKDIHRYYFTYKKSIEADSMKILGKSFVSTEAVEKYDIRRRFYAETAEKAAAARDFRETRKILINDLLLLQGGLSGTKHSLLTGVITRDPTRDKRLAELLVRFPVRQFVRGGVNRRLVREYLKDDLPGHVTLNQRGIQSADTAIRMLPHWERIYDEITAIYSKNADGSYVDCEKALRELEIIKETPANIKAHEIFPLLRLQYTAMALEFVHNVNSTDSRDIHD